MRWKGETIMSYISTLAKVCSANKLLGPTSPNTTKCYPIPKDETSFGGQGVLTLEMYKRILRETEKWRRCDSW